MFGYINQSLSIPARLALVCLLLAIPSVLAMTLFVAQSWKGIAFADKEVAGVEYLQQIWSSMVATANGGSASAANDATNKTGGEFGTTNASAAFRNAPNRGKRLADGVTLIAAVADASNLTLDPDLDSFYAMDAATVRLPMLMAAADELSAAVAKTTADRQSDVAWL